MKQELFRRQVDRSTKLHDVLMHYDMVLDQSGETSDYERLRKAIDKFLAQRKQQSQRLELARSGVSSSTASKKLHTTSKVDGEVLTSSKTCRTWMYKGNCPRRERCPYDHPPDQRGSKRTKGEGKGKRNSSSSRSTSKTSRSSGKRSQSSRSSRSSSHRSSSRGKENKKGNGKRKGKSKKGKGDAKICKAYMMGKCKHVDACHYFHPAPCKYYLQNSCRESDDTCMYAHLSKKSLAAMGLLSRSQSSKVSSGASKSSSNKTKKSKRDKSGGKHKDKKGKRPDSPRSRKKRNGALSVLLRVDDASRERSPSALQIEATTPQFKRAKVTIMRKNRPWKMQTHAYLQGARA